VERECFHGNGLNNAISQRLSVFDGMEISLGVFRLLLAILSLFFGFVGGVGANNGLMAEYHFDGNANDSSGNGNEGTVNGAAYVSGIGGQALSFQGVEAC